MIRGRWVFVSIFTLMIFIETLVVKWFSIVVGRLNFNHPTCIYRRNKIYKSAILAQHDDACPREINLRIYVLLFLIYACMYTHYEADKMKELSDDTSQLLRLSIVWTDGREGQSFCLCCVTLAGCAMVGFGYKHFSKLASVCVRTNQPIDHRLALKTVSSQRANWLPWREINRATRRNLFPIGEGVLFIVANIVDKDNTDTIKDIYCRRKASIEPAREQFLLCLAKHAVKRGMLRYSGVVPSRLACQRNQRKFASNFLLV